MPRQRCTLYVATRIIGARIRHYVMIDRVFVRAVIAATAVAIASSSCAGTPRPAITIEGRLLTVDNRTSQEWKDVEVWVNQKYVVHLPVIPHQNKGEGYRHLNFQLLYDNQGNYFPVSIVSSKMRVEKVEVCYDGKMYDVPVRLAD